MANLPPLLVDLPRNPFLALGIPVAAGTFAGVVTRTSSRSPDSVWYKSLNRPTWEPPKWAFGVAWPILYVFMGTASHLTVKALHRTPPGLGRTRALTALKLYYAQLTLNQLWTPLFFGAGELYQTVAGRGRCGWRRREWAALTRIGPPPPPPLSAGQISAAFVTLTALTGTVATWGWTLKDVDERAAWLTVPYIGACRRKMVLGG